MSRRKVAGSRLKTRRWRPIAFEFEVDFDVEAKASLGRKKLGAGVAALDAHRFKDLEMAP